MLFERKRLFFMYVLIIIIAQVLNFDVSFHSHNGNQTTMGKYLTTLYARIMTAEELQEVPTV